MDLSVNKVITTIYSIHKLQTDRNRKNIPKLLGQLNNEMMKKLPHTVKVKVLFHQDRARVHKYIVVVMKCEKLGHGVFPLQSYSADLAFCVNWETSKKWSRRRDFTPAKKSSFKQTPISKTSTNTIPRGSKNSRNFVK